ncbi:MAG TPA: GNAT family N-acetyltransferase [Thermoanaerobaculia bacterium]|nr:GNAT family N-acetyltransferase [Thermoanaerobaculia bacterium]
MRDDVEAALALCDLVFADWKMTPCLKVTPFSRPANLETRLLETGWAVATTLTHMVKSTGTATQTAQGIGIRVCTTEDDVRTFSEVQSTAFGAPEWVRWVHKVNVVNVPRTDQRFYVADVDGEPSGVCLLVVTGDVAGLYAVATLPAVRHRGVARALVDRAASDARDMGASVLCLNTLKHGPAEQAFARLGFQSVFESKFYSHQLPA